MLATPKAIGVSGLGGLLSGRVVGFACVAAQVGSLFASAQAHPESVNVFAGAGSFSAPTPAGNTLDTPAGVGVAPDGSVVIVDTGHNRVLAIKDAQVSVIAGGGGAHTDKDREVFSANDATKIDLRWPRGIAVAPDGTIMIADSHMHRVLAVKDNHASVFAGDRDATSGKKVDPADATKTRLTYPEGVAVAADGTVVIADTGNHRVLSVKDNRVAVIAGDRDGTRGKQLDVSNPLRTRLDWPHGVAVGSDGTVVITDTSNNRVLAVKDNRLRVIADHRTNVTSDTQEATSQTLLDKSHTTTTGLRWPRGVAVTPEGTIVIADTDNNRVLAVKNGQVKVIAGDCNAAEGHTIDACDPTKTRLNSPTGVAVGPEGTLVIADANNHRILVIGEDHFYRQELEKRVARGIEVGEQDADELRREFFELTYLGAPIRGRRALKTLSKGPARPRSV